MTKKLCPKLGGVVSLGWLVVNQFHSKDIKNQEKKVTLDSCVVNFPSWLCFMLRNFYVETCCFTLCLNVRRKERNYENEFGLREKILVIKRDAQEGWSLKHKML